MPSTVAQDPELEQLPGEKMMKKKRNLDESLSLSEFSRVLDELSCEIETVLERSKNNSKEGCVNSKKELRASTAEVKRIKGELNKIKVRVDSAAKKRSKSAVTQERKRLCEEKNLKNEDINLNLIGL